MPASRDPAAAARRLRHRVSPASAPAARSGPAAVVLTRPPVGAAPAVARARRTRGTPTRPRSRAVAVVGAASSVARRPTRMPAHAGGGRPGAGPRGRSRHPRGAGAPAALLTIAAFALVLAAVLVLGAQANRSGFSVVIFGRSCSSSSPGPPRAARPRRSSWPASGSSPPRPPTSR
ncbi:hypothetical protein ACFQX7_25360 [Luedemannella flava]